MEEVSLADSDSRRKYMLSEYVMGLPIESKSENIDDDLSSDLCEDESMEVIDEDEILEDEDNGIEEPSGDNVSTNSDFIFKADSGRLYTILPPKKKKRTLQDIFRCPATGYLPQDEEFTTILGSFLQFFPFEFRSLIIQYTNMEAHRKGVPPMSDSELLGLLGVLICMGVEQDCQHSICHLWSNKYSKPMYTVPFSRNRFSQLIKILCFDDQSTRDERKKVDNFAPFREVFNFFNNLCKEKFIPGMNVTIDDMLSLFRGKCPFKVFMKNKPGKYGILIRMLMDSETRYVVNMEPYCGKLDPVSEGRGPSYDGSTAIGKGPTAVVKRLLDPIKGTSRNVTTDCSYTSVELAEDLYNDYQITLVGTLNETRKHIPECMKNTQGRELYSTKVLYTEPTSGRPPVTLVSYLTKIKPKKKILLLLSTQNDNVAVDEEHPMKKTDVELFYNYMKGGMDTVDSMVRLYSCKRGTQRWTLSLFYTLVDIAALNAFTLFSIKNPGWRQNGKKRRKTYYFQLAEELIKPITENRMSNMQCLDKPKQEVSGEKMPKPMTSGLCQAEPEHNLQKNAELGVAEQVDPGPLGQVEPSPVGLVEPSPRRKYCYKCVANAKNRKIRENRLSKMKQCCVRCGRNVCKKHSIIKIECNENCLNPQSESE